MISVEARIEHWPIGGSFTISRGAKTEAVVLVVTLHDGDIFGWGEGTPYAHFGESPERALSVVEKLSPKLERGMGRDDVVGELEPGATRNAIDAALWDLECQRARTPVWSLAGLAKPAALTTAYTLSLASPEETERAASAQRHRPLLKLKVGKDPESDIARVQAARRGAPDARFIVDANEGWSVAAYEAIAPKLAELGVMLVEQPVAPAVDEALAATPHAVPLCADESFRKLADIPLLATRYDALNVKLDKVGGLTSALPALAAAREAGLSLMVGCHVCTSLAVAPAMLVASQADVVDLDAGALLARDREGGVIYKGSTMEPCPTLWGIPR